MCLWYLFRSRTQPAKPSKPLFLQWMWMILPFGKNMNLETLMIFSVTNFGIDFWWVGASIWAPLWHHIPCFGVIVFWNDFWCDALIDVDKKCSLFASEESIKTCIFSNLFRSWCFWKFRGSTCLPFGSMSVVFVRFGMHFGSLWA